nr:PREDICTED: GDSL esterase/lipase EXL3-like [Nicotiana tabacum]
MIEFLKLNTSTCVVFLPPIFREKPSNLTMKFLSFKIYSSLVCYSLLVCYVKAVTRIPYNESIPAVIVFGDSIVDTGNNNGLKTVSKVNYPPYGQDFMGGKPTGRFSNGKVPADLIVEELGIKELLPAYLDPTLQPKDLITGVNFASGGAGYDPLTSELAKVISLSRQLEMFKEYILKLREIVGEDKKNEILANSLFILVTGTNDIINTYFNTPLRKSYYDVSSYADLLVNSASSFVQDLYGLGARRIGVFGIPPIGCLPSQRTLRGGEERECVDYLNQAAQLFNSKLAAELSSLGNEFPDSRMVYVDVYNLPLDVIYNPQKYGFKISDKGCCGTGKIEVAELCTFTCSSDSDYVFWDSFHLTEKAYRQLVHQILAQHLSSFF